MNMSESPMEEDRLRHTAHVIYTLNKNQTEARRSVNVVEFKSYKQHKPIFGNKDKVSKISLMWPCVVWLSSLVTLKRKAKPRYFPQIVICLFKSLDSLEKTELVVLSGVKLCR